MIPMDRTVRTPLGSARVRLADSWVGVTVAGELLERDVWDVTWTSDDVTVTRRVKTFPEPDDAALQDAVLALLRDEAHSTR